MDAHEMYYLAIEKGYFPQIPELLGIWHFRAIENNLNANEKILMTFIGLYNYINIGKNGGFCACALTDSRLLVARKSFVNETLQSISVSYISDITFHTNLLMGIMSVNFMQQRLSIAFGRKAMRCVHKDFTTWLHQVKAHSSVSSVF